jgi:hypothetical protein
MDSKINLPYLAYSDLTNRVYIVIDKETKIDVTSQYEYIVREREKI